MWDLMNDTAQPVQRRLPAEQGPTVVSTDGLVGMRALERILQVVDYGMLVVLSDHHVVWANHVARLELDDEHPLQLLGHELRARCPTDVATLGLALANAQHHDAQTMVTLGRFQQCSLTLSVLPLGDVCGGPAALLVFGRRSIGEDLRLESFARQHQLTLAETRVLKLLFAGGRPADIASALGVRLSTVRTQVGSIRAKTRSADVGDLLHSLSQLPPLPCRIQRAA